MSEHTAENDVTCPKCGGVVHRLSERSWRCNLGHLTRVTPLGRGD